MRKPWQLFVIISVSATACSDGRQPLMSDEDVALLRESAPGIDEECVERFRYCGIDAIPSDVTTCYAMTEAQQFQGIWRTKFEGSTFCPNATDFCEATLAGPNIWLSTSGGVELPVEPASGDTPRYFELTFIGRQTLEEGFHGHMGASGHEVVVEELLSAREIWPDPASSRN